MALETLTVVDTDRTGAIQGAESVTNAGGFRFLNNGHTFLVVTNDGVGAKVLTFKIQPTPDTESVTVRTITVLVSERWVMGPWPTKWYNDANGYCIVTIDVDLANGVAAISMEG